MIIGPLVHMVTINEYVQTISLFVPDEFTK